MATNFTTVAGSSFVSNGLMAVEVLKSASDALIELQAASQNLLTIGRGSEEEDLERQVAIAESLTSAIVELRGLVAACGEALR
ncbi:hypothetical protein [Sphingomonas crocodyli]|uniref:Uncharacterized protein n=1 Tax=Sphingomonas crocodyli TaxID=1979270 RepID=A0A437M129_9SPHN|nr:hypothetical protein [Sphingomonas crocodyli]RVT91286.1 hypothetical protein EOD43_17415 [Sphingomonas crocodyli]